MYSLTAVTDFTKSPIPKIKTNADDELNTAPISYDMCKKISYITQTVAILIALVAFIDILDESVTKLISAHIQETRESISENDAWFNIAICMRPELTPSLMRKFYKTRTKYGDIQDFTAYLHHRNRMTEGGISWTNKTWLDTLLRPKEYREYFEVIHPWEKLKVSDLWEFQYQSIQNTFNKFIINDVHLTKGVDLRVAPWNKTTSNYTLLGDYFTSPVYAGCLNVTVAHKMSHRHMSIDVIMNHKLSESNAHSEKEQTTIFEAADVFVYGKSDTFTELPVVQQLAKYSVRGTTLERLHVTAALYEHTESHINCNNATDYSQTNCRYWCIMRALLGNVHCTLPWMTYILQKPWVDARYKQLPACSTSETFMHTLDVQQTYLFPREGILPVPARHCFMDCRKPCNSFKVELLPRGSKPVSSGHGISLMVSPHVVAVAEHVGYTWITMIGELSKAAGFLIGFSVIGLYDGMLSVGQEVAAVLATTVAVVGAVLRWITTSYESSSGSSSGSSFSEELQSPLGSSGLQVVVDAPDVVLAPLATASSLAADAAASEDDKSKNSDSHSTLVWYVQPENAS